MIRLSQINQKASDLLNEYIQLHGTEDMYPIIEYAYSLVNRYGGASSELACQMYDQLAKLQNANVIGAVPADLPEMSDVARAINGTKDKLNGPADAIGRLVKKSASDTMLQNAKRDGAEYAWITRGDSCPYCLYLSSFGWLHANLNNGNRYLGHIHNHCDCEFAIRFDGKSTVEGYDPHKISEWFNRFEGKNPEEKINSIRRQQKIDKYGEDVTERFIAKSTPGKGGLYFDKDYKQNDHKKEISVGNWLYKNFGGEINLLNESSKISEKRPDYLWNGKKWELKNPTTTKATDSAVRKGLLQIHDNGKGLILDYEDNPISLNEARKIASQRIHRSSIDADDIYIIFKRNNKKTIVIKYKKDIGVAPPP